MVYSQLRRIANPDGLILKFMGKNYSLSNEVTSLREGRIEEAKVKQVVLVEKG